MIYHVVLVFLMLVIQNLVIVFWLWKETWEMFLHNVIEVKIIFILSKVKVLFLNAGNGLIMLILFQPKDLTDFTVL